MSTGRATWTPSEVQEAIAEDFAYVVNSAADHGDSTMDLCISYLPDEVAEMLADSVVRAGLAYNTPPPALAPTAPPSSSTSPAPKVVAYKAPPPGFGPSAKAPTIVGPSTTGPAQRPMSAAEFLGPLADEGFVKAPPPRRPTTSTRATPEPTDPSPAAEWQSTEDQRAANRAGFFSPIAWQLHCQGWVDEDEMKRGLAAGFVDGDSFRAHVAESPAPSVFPPIRRDPTPALEDRRSPQFPFGGPEPQTGSRPRRSCRPPSAPHFAGQRQSPSPSRRGPDPRRSATTARRDIDGCRRAREAPGAGGPVPSTTAVGAGCEVLDHSATSGGHRRHFDPKDSQTGESLLARWVVCPPVPGVPNSPMFFARSSPETAVSTLSTFASGATGRPNASRLPRRLHARPVRRT